MLKERVSYIESPEAVESFMAENPNSVIFKAGTCHKTMQGFGVLQQKLKQYSNLKVGVIRVVEARAASNLVTEKTGVKHESPQVLLFKDGRVVFDVDNWNITPEALNQGFTQLPTAESAEPSQASSDLKPYKQILEQYLSGVIDDSQFEFAYTHMFREDATLRSGKEVEILNSIFGDVDQHVNMHLMMAGQTSDHNAVRQRALAAYEQLKNL